jgi:hypothetical protein
MNAFDPAELAYLAERRLARLATVGRNGTSPGRHVAPQQGLRQHRHHRPRQTHPSGDGPAEVAQVSARRRSPPAAGQRSGSPPS